MYFDSSESDSNNSEDELVPRKPVQRNCALDSDSEDDAQGGSAAPGPAAAGQAAKKVVKKAVGSIPPPPTKTAPTKLKRHSRTKTVGPVVTEKEVRNMKPQGVSLSKTSPEGGNAVKLFQHFGANVCSLMGNRVAKYVDHAKRVTVTPEDLTVADVLNDVMAELGMPPDTPLNMEAFPGTNEKKQYLEMYMASVHLAGLFSTTEMEKAFGGPGEVQAQHNMVVSVLGQGPVEAEVEKIISNKKELILMQLLLYQKTNSVHADSSTVRLDKALDKGQRPVNLTATLHHFKMGMAIGGTKANAYHVGADVPAILARFVHWLTCIHVTNVVAMTLHTKRSTVYVEDAKAVNRIQQGFTGWS
jgi:histone H3/H4